MNRGQIAFKGILLIAMGLFLYSRIANGSLYFYINERFMGYTLFAVVALLAVGVSYQLLLQRPDEADERAHTLELAGHSHDHRLSWGGALLVLTPIILGLLVTPQPLGASAMDVRQVDLSQGVGALPAAVRAAQTKGAAERNVLEWNQALQTAGDPLAELDGEPVDVVGFVYRDERFAANQFFVMRFVVSCCAADAAVAGLVVDWPESATLETDAWVRVTGTLRTGQLDAQELLTVNAESIERVERPQQPYLYP